MAADKRNFSDFRKFPGEIKENGIYEFPKLYHIVRGKRRSFHSFIRLVKDSNRQSIINWNIFDENQIPILPKYIDTNEKIPKGITVQMWSESGQVDGKITRTIPTYINSSVLVGRANERNALQQAMIKGRAKYLKKLEQRGTTDISGEKKDRSVKVVNAKAKPNVNAKPIPNANVMYFPMLAKPWKAGSKHLTYPLYVQPKLDGVRCLAYCNGKDAGVENLILYTRTHKIFPDKQYLKEILYKYLNDKYLGESMYLDGELYIHGARLQDISGKSRNVDSDNPDDILQYHIYDSFYPSQLDNSFHNRHQELKSLYDSIDNKLIKYKSINKPINPKDIIKLNPTIIVNTLAEGKKLYEDYIADDYEGLIFRNYSAGYKASSINSHTRSNDLVKMKNRFSDEFMVIGYKQGTAGKDVGAIIWICKTIKGDEFNVTPKDKTYKERYELFSDAEDNFENKFLNRMLTVEYEDLSKKGIPLRAKGTVFRDYE